VFLGIGMAGVMTFAAGMILQCSSRFAGGFAPLSISLYVVTSVVISPFVEECYFRGILFVALLDKVGALGSVILTTLLFAAVHPLYRLVLIFLTVGLVLGIARVKTNSVAAVSCFTRHTTSGFSGCNCYAA
jgi:membrane protease YdiL (CAAX protease family)